MRILYVSRYFRKFHLQPDGKVLKSKCILLTLIVDIYV